MRWTQQQYNDYIAKRLPVVGAVDRKKRESDPKPALDSNSPSQSRRNRRMDFCVSIVSFRHRLLDGDNNASGGNKALRDAIAKTLGIDDGSERIRWQYGQVHTTGEEGTLVAIERIEQ